MQIKRVSISNFRSIRHLEVHLGSNTVFIGPNNAGKTAVLEAIRIALTRRWGQRGTGFTEYDVHLCETRTDPKVGDPVVIEIEMQESAVDVWPDELNETLADIIQRDPQTGRASILLRVSCAWDQEEEAFQPKWEFLNSSRSPLQGRSARSTNFQEFFSYLPVFYLGALRDVSDEFSARSQFWGRLLRAVQIPPELETHAVEVFNELNAKLLAADPLLTELASSLSDISKVASSGSPGQADLRVLPLHSWDLLSKAEVIYKTNEDKPWLPLQRHGQGVQSLSILFVFRSFLEHLLFDLYRPASTPVLALEEPETHLHPQAARSLFGQVQALSGQKIVSTHSPYFLQHVPFRDIRVLRAGPNGTEVKSLPKEFRCRIPHTAAIDPIIQKSNGLLEYDRSLSELVIKGELSTDLFRDLLAAYGNQSQEINSNLRKAKNASSEFISDAELAKLETFARRIRGEIFFANKWLLVEGQSEYHIVHGMAKAMGFDLDVHGVAVIDFQNNGNPECFAALARALGYPWFIVVDGDQQGETFLRSVRSRNFTEDQMTNFTRRLNAGTLEHQLVADGLRPELTQILRAEGALVGDAISDEELVAKLKSDKCGYAATLAALCASDAALTQRMPSHFRDAIVALGATQ